MEDDAHRLIERARKLVMNLQECSASDPLTQPMIENALFAIRQANTEEGACEEALALLAKVPHLNDERNTLTRLVSDDLKSDLLQRAGRRREGLTVRLRLARKLQELEPHGTRTKNTLVGCVFLAGELGAFEEAEPIIRDVVDATADSPRATRTAVLLVGAVVYGALGRFSDALPLVEAALANVSTGSSKRAEILELQSAISGGDEAQVRAWGRSASQR
jgi:hypothetical protein